VAVDRARACSGVNTGQRAPSHRGRAGGDASVGHRPGWRLVRHGYRCWDGGQRWVGYSGGGLATPSQAMLPRARVSTGRTRQTVVALEGGGSEDSGGAEGSGTTQAG
jgi:hypothetical protein